MRILNNCICTSLHHCDLKEAVTIADLMMISVVCVFQVADLTLNFELQIMSDRRSGHINFWYCPDCRCGSVNFMPIYDQITDLTVSPSVLFSGCDWLFDVNFHVCCTFVWKSKM